MSNRLSIVIEEATSNIMTERTMYVESIENVWNSRYVEAFNYRRNNENLGILGLLEDQQTWVVLDFMNNIELTFSSQRKAKAFIKQHTPILEKEVV